jgi:hypothetical protein
MRRRLLIRWGLIEFARNIQITASCKEVLVRFAAQKRAGNDGGEVLLSGQRTPMPSEDRSVLT